MVYQRSTNGQPSIGEDRLGKDSIDKGSGVEEKNASTPILYGQFNNVKLSDEEYKNLEEQLENHTKIMIDKLSRYMKSSGKSYDNHYATLLHWYEEDKDKLTQNRSNKNQIYNYDDSPSI